MTQMVEIMDTIEMVENVEIANIHAGLTQVAENRTECQKWLGEYPTLSAILCSPITQLWSKKMPDDCARP